MSVVAFPARRRRSQISHFGEVYFNSVTPEHGAARVDQRLSDYESRLVAMGIPQAEARREREAFSIAVWDWIDGELDTLAQFDDAEEASGFRDSM